MGRLSPRRFARKPTERIRIRTIALSGSGRAGVRRAWLPLLWLLGTAAAVVVAWSAVQVIASQVVERRPEPLSAQAVQKLEATPTTSPSPESVPESPRPASTAPPASPPSGSPPVTTTAPPNGGAGSTPNPSAVRSSRTFTLQGGTASVSCQNNQISLNWATPNAGFQVELDWHDSNSVLEVRFRSDTHESRLESWCSGGQVQSSVEESSS